MRLLAPMLAGVLAGAAPSHAKVVVIPDDVPSLALALNPATNSVEPGDIIELTTNLNEDYLQTYEVTIPDLTIRAAEGETIEIDPVGTGPCFVVDLSSPGTLRLEGLTMVNGRASLPLGFPERGAAINSESASLTMLEVVDCTIRDCVADNAGGAFYLVNTTLLADGCAFVNNRSGSGLAGAIRVFDSRATILDSTFTGNRALSATDTGTGGAIAVRGDASSLLVEGCHFEDNEAGNGGGAIYTVDNTTSVVLRDTTFRANLAVKQNSADAGGVICTDADSLLVERCVFDANRCDGQGGGLRTVRVPGTVVDTRFVGNLASEAAGVLLLASSDVRFYNCVFENNDATQPGAGLGDAGAVQSNTGSVGLFVNCLFVGNKGVNGGAVSVNDATARFDNCTLAGNEATGAGGAIAATNAAAVITLENSVVWGNTPVPDPLVGLDTVRYSLVEGGAAGEGNIDTDPMFADAAGGDYTLAPGSPAIDAADNFPYQDSIGPYQDLAGNARVVDDPDTPDTGLSLIGPVIDMGCYEFGELNAPSACLGDLDGDDDTDVFDFAILADGFGCDEK
jgi:predicted outer membrane repeat protein